MGVMNMYLVFAYYQYYPAGGMGDFQKAFPSKEEALSWAAAHRSDYDHIDIEDIRDYI